MCSNNRDVIRERFDALAAGLDAVLDLDFSTLTGPEHLAVLERVERIRRRLPAVEHPVINQLAAEADPVELGGKLCWALADRLRISRGEARRRISDAADLGLRRGLTGEPLEPMLPATAVAQRTGEIGAEHVTVIRRFAAALPDHVDVETRGLAEAQLAGFARQYRPDELGKLAARLFDCLNPDGNFSDEDRARRRCLILGRQGADGMSPISGYLDPQARATVDAVLAKLAGPGMCNPADEKPCVSGTPGQAAIDADTRSAAQRNHDALTAMGRALLASGDLGQHNGLPASIVISVGLADLQAAAGKAVTGGGTWLPVRDAIRLAGHADHWLRIFDGAKEVALFHTRRIASPGQRIVLYARDRGCTHPGCDVPAHLCEAHHVTDYKLRPETDVHGLTLRCGPHHKLITPGGWSTRQRADGRVETIPPAHLDHGRPRVNHYHHPEKLLQERDADDDPA